MGTLGFLTNAPRPGFGVADAASADAPPNYTTRDQRLPVQTLHAVGLSYSQISHLNLTLRQVQWAVRHPSSAGATRIDHKQPSTRTALLRTCKKLHKEATPILYSNSFYLGNYHSNPSSPYSALPIPHALTPRQMLRRPSTPTSPTQASYSTPRKPRASDPCVWSAGSKAALQRCVKPYSEVSTRGKCGQGWRCIRH